VKVALIGGTGFVGGYLVDALLDADHEPCVLVRPGSESKVRHPDSCRIVSGEVADSDALRQLFDGVDAVIYNIGILRAIPGPGITFEKPRSRGRGSRSRSCITKALRVRWISRANAVCRGSC
jgi:NADH dehydrogenase